jgi:TRAP-type transport system periplasmic protein
MNRIRNALTGAICLSVSALVTGQAFADTLIRWTDGSADRGSRAESYHWFADTVTKRTNGAVKFQFYFGGALMGHAAHLSGVGSGAADMAQMVAAYTPRELAPYTLGDLPLVGIDPWVATRAMYELTSTDPTLQKMFSDQNLVYISNQTTGPVEIVCNKVNIKSVDDLKGVKVRAAGSLGEVLSDLGANIVGISQNDAYSALDTGLIGCNQQYIQSLIKYRQHEVTDQIVMLNMGQYLGFGLAMNKDTFDKLTPAQRAIVKQTGSEFVDHYVHATLDEMNADLEKMKTPGTEFTTTVTEISPDDVNKLKAAGAKYIDKWLAKTTEAGYPAKDMLDRYMALVDKYNAELKEKGYPWTR